MTEREHRHLRPVKETAESNLGFRFRKHARQCGVPVSICSPAISMDASFADRLSSINRRHILGMSYQTTQPQKVPRMFQGPVYYLRLDEVLEFNQVFVGIYGYVVVNDNR